MTPPDTPDPGFSLRTCFWRGAVQALPFLVALVPFSLLFGVLARAAGLDLWQASAMSVLVLAGASQLTIVELLQQQAPAVVVILSGLAVNLRLAMYSASLTQWLGQAPPAARAGVAYALVDQTYVLALREYERFPRLGIDRRLAYFAGSALVTVLPWIAMTWLGAVLGRALPITELGLDIAVPVMFIAMIAPSLRTAPHLVAATVSVVLALALHGLPSGLGLLVAAPFAMLAGALTEQHLNRRRAARHLQGGGR